MNICSHVVIGSRNPIKVAAVEEVLSTYKTFEGAIYRSFGASSGVNEQPTTLEETIRGARNRATAADLRAEEIGVGIESGIMYVPGAGFMDVCACVISFPLPAGLGELRTGLSSAWVLPPEVAHHVRAEGLNLTEACIRAGLTTEADIGDREGAVGILSGGRVTRKSYTKQAIEMALIGVP